MFSQPYVKNGRTIASSIPLRVSESHCQFLSCSSSSIPILAHLQGMSKNWKGRVVVTEITEVTNLILFNAAVKIMPHQIGQMNFFQ